MKIHPSTLLHIFATHGLHLNAETLEPQGADDLDFHELHITNLMGIVNDVFASAYNQGLNKGWTDGYEQARWDLTDSTDIDVSDGE